MDEKQKSEEYNPFQVRRSDLILGRLQDTSQTLLYILACAWLLRELFNG